MGCRLLEIEVLARVSESCGKLEVDPRGRPSPMCNTTARTGKSPSTEDPLPSDEAVFPRLAREDPDPPGSGLPPGPRREPEPRPDPAGDHTHRTGPGFWAAAPGGKGSAPSDASGNVRADRLRSVPIPAFPLPRITIFLLFPNNLTGVWFSLTGLAEDRESEPEELSQCTCRCVVLPDVCLSSPATDGSSLSQCTYRCVVLPDLMRSLPYQRPTLVSMHLQVRGAP